MNPDLHKTIAVKAKKEGQSLNSWIEKCLCEYTS
ncbi:toxin-antitoxin system HicB family antitoxin [Fortiea sp. LEGE XX443]